MGSDLAPVVGSGRPHPPLATIEQATGIAAKEHDTTSTALNLIGAHAAHNVTLDLNRPGVSEAGSHGVENPMISDSGGASLSGSAPADADARARSSHERTFGDADKQW